MAVSNGGNVIFVKTITVLATKNAYPIHTSLAKTSAIPSPLHSKPLPTLLNSLSSKNIEILQKNKNCTSPPQSSQNLQVAYFSARSCALASSPIR